MKTLWNSRTASEYRMPLLYNCSTSFSSCSFTANSPQRSSVEFSCRRAILYGRQHHRLRRKQGRCYVRPSENTREKGCDIGYALAAGSCEEAASVETCTVTAPRCDHCFRSPRPQLLLAEQSVFSGLVAQQVTLPS